MRIIHLARPEGGASVQPFCGDWNSMDTGWTDDRAAVTCDACRKAIGEVAPSPAPAGYPRK